ncbi:zinc finger MYM-type-like protein [Rhynchospora pubera]|uniref:Zinc finger MYM-type-like protein n=1 Tax=Rhynchospora pubera TaxID=906938 RepID=A0AAV8G9F3_9POAL|nr:zinc finger MYM-type-like protein [Rhynchospora pubera]KAJ4800815.1 zinc finger MYM-type-like protein [Rhynchospora pubera]
MKRKTIESFFKKAERCSSSQEPSASQVQESPVRDELPVQVPSKQPRIEPFKYERDPGKRLQIDEYPPNQRDEVRRFYISEGPYQPYMDEYPYAEGSSHRRRFQYNWFKKFPWLEYSSTTNRAYCYPCFLFTTKPNGRCGSDTFTVKGFQNWRKVNDGKECAFLRHVGQTMNSAHNFAIGQCDSLKDSTGHIENVIVKRNEKVVEDARLRLKTSIDAVKWLTFQACAFRGHDESSKSKNQGCFLEMIKLLAHYNKEVNGVVLDNAPKNAKYTSHEVQKEILNVFSRKVQTAIRDEIGNGKFCLIVDESRDESKKEQMAIVIRFVDKDGFIRERFLDIVHVKDTAALTLKNSICAVLSNNSLNVQDIRGQGYDGASNMRGEWNGLKALILKECPCAYYVHCMAHQLQLALVAASREVHKIHNFIQDAIFIINVVSASSKRNDELLTEQAEQIAREVELGELESGRGANQIGSLQRPVETRWSSHYNSICSLARLFGATVSVLRSIAKDRSVSVYSRGDASGSLQKLLSFDFVFIMHLMKEIMAITDTLCVALQNKSLDILNALNLVSSTKVLIQKLRDDGWEPLLEKVNSFCQKHEVEVPDMNLRYVDFTQSRNKHDNTTVEHHYRVDIFAVAIDQQLQELNARFSEQSMELFTLAAALDPKNSKKLNIEEICTLVEKFYPADFSVQDRAQLESQLPHYQFDVCNHPELLNSSTLPDLSPRLVKIGKFIIYPMVDRLIRLIMTLPVSTATTERAFSAMKLIKTGLRNRMGDGFLRDYMIVYIEKEIAEKFNSDEIIDLYDLLGNRRSKFKLIEI